MDCNLLIDPFFKKNVTESNTAALKARYKMFKEGNFKSYCQSISPLP